MARPEESTKRHGDVTVERAWWLGGLHGEASSYDGQASDLGTIVDIGGMVSMRRRVERGKSEAAVARSVVAGV
jgi:hypothetical protein